MVDHSSANDRERDRDRERPTSSPWPLLIALGLAGSEVGVVLGVLPVAVAGLVLFAASVAGILTESGHVSSPWPVAIGFGAVFGLVGTALYALGTGTVTAAPVDGLVGLTARGIAIALAGLVTVVGAVIGRHRRQH